MAASSFSVMGNASSDMASDSSAGVRGLDPQLRYPGSIFTSTSTVNRRDPSTLMKNSHLTAHEISNLAVDCSKKLKDTEAAYEQNMQRMKHLAAELEAAKMQVEKDQQLAKDLRHQQHMHEAMLEARISAEQKLEKQKQFRASIDDEIIKSLKDLANTDHGFKTAIELIARNEANKPHYEVIGLKLMHELVGRDNEHLRDFAIRVWNYDCSSITHPIDGQKNLHEDNNQNVDDIDKDMLPAGQETSAPNSQSPTADRSISPEVRNVAATVIAQSQLANIQTTAESVAAPANDEPMLDINDTTDQVIVVAQTQDHPDQVEIQPDVQVKSEQDTALTPTAKRLKLTDIEGNAEPTQLQQLPDMTMHDAPTGPKTPGTGVSTPVIQSRASTGLGDTENKRKRIDQSVDSQSSKTSTIIVKGQPSTPSEGKVPAYVKAFKTRLDRDFAQGVDVLPELNCQKCGHYPEDPRVTSCSHIYCDKCLAKTRKAALKTNGETRCTTCTHVIGKRATKLSTDQIDAWKDEYDNTNGEDSGEGTD